VLKTVPGRSQDQYGLPAVLRLACDHNYLQGLLIEFTKLTQAEFYIQKFKTIQTSNDEQYIFEDLNFRNILCAKYKKRLYAFNS
jgi:hypothetical protein